MSQTTEEDVTRLRMVIQRVSRRLRQQARSGITASQISALATIERFGPITLGELAGRENVQPPTISRIVGALEGEGWVERAADDRDRRVAVVQVTPSARRELRHIRAERNAWLTARLEAMGGSDRRKLLAALPALERLLDEDEQP